MKLVSFRKVGTRHGDGVVVLMHRWSFWLPRGWSIKLHHILRPDQDRCHHDHPWRFWTLILWGGYVEEIRGPVTIVRRNVFGMIRKNTARHTHRVTELIGHTVWTIGLYAPREREWGFMSRTGGWVPWNDFTSADNEERAAWCES